MTAMKFNPDYKPTIGKNQCVHGNLKRKCEVCELERENAELRTCLSKLMSIRVQEKGVTLQEFHKLYQRTAAIVENKRKIKELPEWSQ